MTRLFLQGGPSMRYVPTVEKHAAEQFATALNQLVYFSSRGYDARAHSLAGKVYIVITAVDQHLAYALPNAYQLKDRPPSEVEPVIDAEAAVIYYMRTGKKLRARWSDIDNAPFVLAPEIVKALDVARQHRDEWA
jgi:hypothetical protein